MITLKRPAKQLLYWVGRRGAFLLFLALLDFIYAFALFSPTPRSIDTPVFTFLVKIMPLWAWAFMWLITGVMCLIYAFKRNDALGYAAAAFTKILWAVMFFLGWMFAGVERGYLSSAIWGTFSLVLILVASWPDPNKGKLP